MRASNSKPLTSMTTITGVLLCLTLLTGAILSAPKVAADASSVIDIEVNVPTACTLTPTNTILTKTINPGASDKIGDASLKAVCNDPSGFAIYTVGYTNDEYGNNALITDLGAEHKIDTGIDEHPTESQWNMTITNTNTTGNYTADINNDFDQPHEVPEVYTKVATVSSITDQTIGTNLNARFDASIASNQPAATYTGKVKFMLVHPATAPTPNDITRSTKDVTVTFNLGSNDYFYLDDNDNPVRTNIVTYHGECENEHTPLEPIVMTTPNLLVDGARDHDLNVGDLYENINYYDSSAHYYVDSYFYRKASKLKVVITYDLEVLGGANLVTDVYSDEQYYENAEILVVGDAAGAGDQLYPLYGGGTREIIVDGDNLEIWAFVADTATIDPDHDYGFHAVIYPLDENGDVITENINCRCEWTITDGEYMVPRRNNYYDPEFDWWEGMIDAYSYSSPIEVWLNETDETELNVYAN